MTYQLEGKTALITGVSSGLGERMAYVLAEHGVKILLTARREEALIALKKEIAQSEYYFMDVKNVHSVRKAFKKIEEDGYQIDICINNAGIGELTPIFQESSIVDFENIIQTNVMGTWYVTQAVALHMKKHKVSGSIINISSVNGNNKLIDEISGYAASKAAVIQMTKALVGELSKANIRINCIAPGIIHTAMTDFQLNTQEAKDEMAKKIPLKFVGAPSDLDGMILYLASNITSKYVTGSCMVVDGGISWGG
jgi:NAD(P)-dependent dehydrogenase (short-subunit alcohol dehydrogenase family)